MKGLMAGLIAGATAVTCVERIRRSGIDGRGHHVPRRLVLDRQRHASSVICVRMGANAASSGYGVGISKQLVVVMSARTGKVVFSKPQP